MNHVILTGNLGSDPETKFSQEGTQVTTFSIAFKSSYKKEEPNWIRVVCFNKNAELAEKYLHKGAKVAVHGMLDQNKWESDGETKTSYQIIVHNIEFIKTDGRGFEDKQEDM